MSEGSLEAPTRHQIPWQEADFTDPEKIDVELRRVIDICHGCRRCFNLCDSFPRLFDLIDESDSGELDTVDSKDFKPAVDACTLCDMCFMTKCPYVPPHEFDLDFPHLMLRYRAMEFAGKSNGGKTSFAHRQITETDRNGKLAAPVAGLANWASKLGNGLTRPVMESVAGIHKEAYLPEFTGKPFEKRAAPPVTESKSRKAALYATCFVNYNNPEIGEATQAILAKNGVETEVVYPSCCGMPQLEQGDIARVAENAKKVSAELVQWIDKGYDIVALVPSCALMLKFEWPLILPEDENVKRLSEATFDATEYIVDIAKQDGLADGLAKLDGPVSLHLACHARAQNMGPKAAEMLRLIPDAQVEVIERCSGHGGAWGVKKENFEVALKIGRPAARKALEQVGENDAAYVVSECPLAREHMMQGIEKLDDENKAATIKSVQHPIQIFAHAYGLLK
ncbi:MAG: glycerol-3-phosphate dehydrogenase [Rhodospirillaceae bacterium]|jgi:glycerol-3-phosphate dehydrogenase subunit C|nr:glycerol-3-phosphate dehydrogenase [Rhodospirillaceae bacterium]MBT4940895.1 glycerol-3-phosphate dehydrogenase [Rhodospirillaceae bacterium]MBT5939794.1 glycerol-3-phosphate dehydrogenase [Rhodospirillaceae bacterium]MBT7266019.1 glycerol-3-phosphate dehydrogenase [Rhodospirillaceae bacterium]